MIADLQNEFWAEKFLLNYFKSAKRETLRFRILLYIIEDQV
jgi:hypothetical protein